MASSGNRKRSSSWNLRNVATGIKHYLYLGETRIGRTGFGSIDIEIPYKFVSRLHSIVHLCRGVVSITDKVSDFLQLRYSMNPS